MRYIGNKKKLLHEIAEVLNLEEYNNKQPVICDLFGGSGTVGDYFKNQAKIIANDLLYSSFVLNKGKLLNAGLPKFAGIEGNIFDTLNKLEIPNNATDIHCIAKNYSPLGDRMYFTSDNALKIDVIRMEIEELYRQNLLEDNEYYYLLASLIESATKFSNITGTYEAYLKHWDSRAIKDFKISPLEMTEANKIFDNCIYNADANDVIRKIEGDILYIDPPYTTTEYSSAYHVLETIAKYDLPNIAGKTGRRTDRTFSAYTKKTALESLEDLVRQAKFDRIVISYSNQGLLEESELMSMLNNYSVENTLKIKKISYRKYKNSRSKNSNKLYEYIISFQKKNNSFKSPLNYSGSKDRLMEQITPYLPAHISTFADMFGGAFNVGLNVVADNYIYNEKSPFTYGIINMISNSNADELIKKIKKDIKKYKLEAEAKEAYVAYRELYNKDTSNYFKLYVLSCFCFQNQLRFNSSMKFNTPVGNCAFNDDIEDRINKFIEFSSKQKIKMQNTSYKEIDLSQLDKDSLLYFDPPYIITKATYNDGKRGIDYWDENSELELLAYLDSLDKMGYKFMLSNVINHKGKVNHILQEWVESKNYKLIKLKSRYREEIIVINYENTKGIR